MTSQQPKLNTPDGLPSVDLDAVADEQRCVEIRFNDGSVQNAEGGATGASDQGFSEHITAQESQDGDSNQEGLESTTVTYVNWHRRAVVATLIPGLLFALPTAESAEPNYEPRGYSSTQIDRAPESIIEPIAVTQPVAPQNPEAYKIVDNDLREQGEARKTALYEAWVEQSPIQNIAPSPVRRIYMPGDPEIGRETMDYEIDKMHGEILQGALVIDPPTKDKGYALTTNAVGVGFNLASKEEYFAKKDTTGDLITAIPYFDDHYLDPSGPTIIFMHADYGKSEASQMNEARGLVEIGQLMAVATDTGVIVYELVERSTENKNTNNSPTSEILQQGRPQGSLILVTCNALEEQGGKSYEFSYIFLEQVAAVPHGSELPPGLTQFDLMLAS